MWDIIITAVVSCITSGGIIQFINWKAAKKKANLDNDSIAVDTLNNVIDTLQKSNDHFEAVNVQREEKITELRNKLTESEANLTLACSYICCNCGCGKRLPPSRGNGRQFIEKLKSGEESPNYEIINFN